MRSSAAGSVPEPGLPICAPPGGPSNKATSHCGSCMLCLAPRMASAAAAARRWPCAPPGGSADRWWRSCAHALAGSLLAGGGACCVALSACRGGSARLSAGSSSSDAACSRTHASASARTASSSSAAASAPPSHASASVIASSTMDSDSRLWNTSRQGRTVCTWAAELAGSASAMASRARSSAYSCCSDAAVARRAPAAGSGASVTDCEPHSIGSCADTSEPYPLSGSSSHAQLASTRLSASSAARMAAAASCMAPTPPLCLSSTVRRARQSCASAARRYSPRQTARSYRMA
mmetsp:Transcript_44183/g.110965  ORF Transcript_44183/g.110965 Transcript_44183/m.110965 type:complete len:292 (-) Transcript_44183:999-1874(-)